MINFTADNKIRSRREELRREAAKIEEDAIKLRKRTLATHSETDRLNTEAEKHISSIIGDNKIVARVATSGFKVEGTIQYHRYSSCVHVIEADLHIPCRDIISIKEIKK